MIEHWKITGNIDSPLLKNFTSHKYISQLTLRNQKVALRDQKVT